MFAIARQVFRIMREFTSRRVSPVRIDDLLSKQERSALTKWYHNSYHYAEAADGNYGE